MFANHLIFLSNILLLSLIPYAKDIIRHLKCGFQLNRYSVVQVLYIRQMLDKMGIK